MPDSTADVDWPKITVVTPSYNQVRFIEGTIRSILLQGYPNLEYIIIYARSIGNPMKFIVGGEKIGSILIEHFESITAQHLA